MFRRTTTVQVLKRHRGLSWEIDWSQFLYLQLQLAYDLLYLALQFTNQNWLFSHLRSRTQRLESSGDTSSGQTSTKSPPLQPLSPLPQNSCVMKLSSAYHNDILSRAAVLSAISCCEVIVGSDWHQRSEWGNFEQAENLNMNWDWNRFMSHVQNKKCVLIEYLPYK